MCNINERTDFADDRSPSKNINEHELKIWPHFFKAVLDGSKKFEIRKNDRNFKIGDKIILKEWDPKIEDYTGRSLSKWISFIVSDGNFGIEKDYCVMSVKSFKKCVIKGGEGDSKCEFWDQSNTNCANREKCVFQKKEIFSREKSREATVSRSPWALNEQCSECGKAIKNHNIQSAETGFSYCSNECAEKHVNENYKDEVRENV